VSSGILKIKSFLPFKITDHATKRRPKSSERIDNFTKKKGAQLRAPKRG